VTSFARTFSRNNAVTLSHVCRSFLSLFRVLFLSPFGKCVVLLLKAAVITVVIHNRRGASMLHSKKSELQR
jgi:hypothetical protein